MANGQFGLTRPRLILSVVTAATLILITGSTAVASTRAKTVSSSGPLIVNMSYPPSTIDPSEGLNEGDFIIPLATYTTLIRYGTKPGPDGTSQVDYGKFEPYLAKSWTISSNSEVYTFNLNTNYRFSDGTPITAADVAFSFQREITMNGGGAYYILDGHYSPILIKSITTPTPSQVVFTLNLPDSGLLDNWAQPAGAVMEPSVVNANGGVVANTVNTWMSGHIAGGGGAYDLTSYNPGVQAILTANPNSPIKGKSHEVIVNFITSPATLGLDARDGEADVTIGIPNATAHSLSKSSSVKVPAYAAPESEYFGFNLGKAPGNNKDLRYALRYATPLPQILSKVAFGYGALFTNPIIPDMPGFNPALSKPAAYDLAKAKAYMKKSGLKTPVHLTVDIEAGDEAGASIGPILQDYWSKVGVDLTLQTLSAPVYVTTTETHKDQSYIRTAGPGVPTVPYYLGYSALCGISFNLTDICIPKVDKLLKEGGAAPTSKQQPYWNQITKLINAKAPRVTFYEIYFPIVLSDKVHSYVFSDEFGQMDTWGF
ncbi:MAG: ABC transporter substrate-binding protein [Candidatus Dormiibacterota bacterium]